MSPDEWKKIVYFKASENWGDAGAISFDLVSALDRYRSYVSVPIAVTCGTQGEHEKNSLHYQGKAVDIVFPGQPIERLFDLCLSAMRFPEFRGIGLYTQWSYKGVKCGGLHLDVRDEHMRSQWMCAFPKVYTSLDVAHLTKAGLL